MIAWLNCIWGGLLSATLTLSHMQILSEADLRKLFSDVQVEYVPECADCREIFHASGKYELHGRGPVSGRFVVREGQICVYRPKELCRLAATDAEGRLYFIRLSGNANELEEIRLQPITVSYSAP